MKKLKFKNSLARKVILSKRRKSSKAKKNPLLKALFVERNNLKSNPNEQTNKRDSSRL